MADPIVPITCGFRDNRLKIKNKTLSLVCKKANNMWMVKPVWQLYETKAYIIIMNNFLKM